LLLGVLMEKKQMLNLQILKLQKLWFDINFDDLMNFIYDKWFWEDSFNKWTISMYLFKGKNKEKNLKILKDNYWEDISINSFYQSCMKSGWEFYNVYKVNTEKYEPDLKNIWEQAKKDNAILSIAHPNFTFKKWIEEFKKELPYYFDLGVNAI
jgi:hypothetical protein